MSDPNPFISSGTCYYDTDEESTSDVLPCGNAELGTKHCCYSGDMCLDETYCFNEAVNMTYTAACTDPAYEDDKCNQLSSDHWDRVIFCVENPSSWIIGYCGLGDPDPLDDSCLCPENDGESYTLNNSFYDNVVLLPESKGESVIWQPGHVPTSSGEPSSSASEKGPGATVTIETESNGAGDIDGRRGGLSVGAKAGIGVGVSLAGLLAIGIMVLLWRRRAKGATAAADTKKSDMAELPERPGTPPPGELEGDVWRSEFAEAGTAANEGSGRRPGEAGNDRAERTASVISELP